ncbi:MAG: hypothetical protein FJZ01_18005 [Candidatus Sericytochromatia bacterium]|nr:hypothetical protein [Candidatus Tanganyikabacteria bacterium]
MARSLPALACTIALAASSGCYRLSYAIADDDNPETVFMAPTESGGVATNFEETVVVYSSLRGLITWNGADPKDVLAKYYNTGKVQNLQIVQEQNFMEGFLTLVPGIAGFLFDMRHVTFRGEVVRRYGS